MTVPEAKVRLRVTNEIGWLHSVLVCSPGEELARVPPDQRERYLVEDVLWVDRAREQHAELTHALGTLMAAAPRVTSKGLVADLRTLLEKALARPGVEAPALALVEELCRIEGALRPPAIRAESEALRTRLRIDPAGIGDDLLAGLLVERPSPAGELFRVGPSPNVVFARDYQFVLGGAAFLSSMAKPIRGKEPTLSRFAFEHALGLQDALVDLRGLFTHAALTGTRGELWVEGGDVMALSRKTVVVGVSERTTYRGATALAVALREARRRDPEAFPFTELCVVELPVRRAMMHLDTVFTLIDEGLALAYPPLTFPGAREEMAVFACRLDVEPEAPATFGWAGRFSQAMASRVCAEGKPLTLVAGGGDRRVAQHREQWCDACNAFAVGPGIAVSYSRNDRTLAALRALDNPGAALLATPGARSTPPSHVRPFEVVSARDLTADLARAAIEGGERLMVCIDGGELGRARGGPHCMTMALDREPLGEGD